jgi:hypothetical protein
VIRRDMNSINEPVRLTRISSSDVADVGSELASYHALYAPLLGVGNSARKASSISRD